MAWDPLLTAEIAAGKVGKTGLFTKIKDCLEYLYGLIGGDSGLIGLRNGGFENDSGSPDYHATNWNIIGETYGGEATVVSTNTAARGAKVLKLNLPGTGDTSSVSIESDKFMVQGNRPMMIRLKAFKPAGTAATLHCQLYFYKADQTASTLTPVTLLPYDWPDDNSASAGYISFNFGGSSPDITQLDKMIEVQAACTVPSDAAWCAVRLLGTGAGAGYYWYIDDVEVLQDDQVIKWVLPSDTLLQSADTEQTTNSTTYVLKKSIQVHRSGKYRVKFDLKDQYHINSTAYGRIYRNGIAWGTERSQNSNGAYVTYSEDVYFARGDTIDIYIKNGNASYTTYVRNFRIYGTDLDFNSYPRVITN